MTAPDSQGVFKSFNFGKGFGFIQSEQVVGDIYCKRESLPAELQDGAFDDSFITLHGRNVLFNLHSTADQKYHARDIVLAYTDEADRLVGTVRSFNEKNMWGFISCASVTGDVYFKVKFLPDHMKGYGGMQGQALSFCCHITEDGKPQANKLVFKSSASGKGKGGWGMFGGDMWGMMGKGGPSWGGMGKSGGAPWDPWSMMAPPMMGKGGGKMGGGKMGGTKRAADVSGMVPVVQKRAKGSGSAVICTVQSFNASKGWGFLASPSVSGDIYFQRKHLTPELQLQLQSSMVDLAGKTGSVEVTWTPDGKPQATYVDILL